MHTSFKQPLQDNFVSPCRQCRETMMVFGFLEVPITGHLVGVMMGGRQSTVYHVTVREVKAESIRARACIDRAHIPYQNFKPPKQNPSYRFQTSLYLHTSNFVEMQKIWHFLCINLTNCLQWLASQTLQKACFVQSLIIIVTTSPESARQTRTLSIEKVKIFFDAKDQC